MGRCSTEAAELRLLPRRDGVARAPAVRRLSSLSAFLPAHDEEENLMPAAEALLRVLPRVAERWELIVVDDGSRDRTGELADLLARRRPDHVRVVHHEENRGYGAALRSGFAAARFEHVFFTDADRQFDVTGLPDLVAALADADVAVGYRRRRADRLARRLISAGWNGLVRRLFRLPLRDVNCAFKLFRRRALAGLAMEADGAMASAELMARIVRRGHRIAQLPVAHFPRPAGLPSGGRPDVIVRAFLELARLHRRLRQRPGERSPTTVRPLGARTAAQL